MYFESILLTRYVEVRIFLKYKKNYFLDNKIKTPLTSYIKNENEGQSKQEEPKDDAEAKKKREQSWKRMKYTLMAFGFSFTCIGAYLIMELGKPRLDDNNDPIEDEFSNMPFWKQYILRTISELDYYRRVNEIIEIMCLILSYFLLVT